MAGLPQLGALLGFDRPLKRPAAKLLDNFTEAFGLLLDARFRSMKLQKQQRHFRQTKLGIKIETLHLHLIGQFDPRHGNTALDGHDDRITRRFHTGKRTDATRNRLGNAVKFQSDFGNDAQSAFRADKQPRQIITCRRFTRARPGFDNAAISHHDRQGQHIVFHRAVTHRIGAGRAG